MDTLILALVPVFAAGVAIQQLLEILDPLVMRLIGERDKKLALGIISILAGFALSMGAGLRILEPLGIMDSGLFDAVVTALIISAGTEGFNSVLKFLGYSKESKKVDAAATKAWVIRDPQAKDLMYRMDRKSRR